MIANYSGKGQVYTNHIQIFVSMSVAAERAWQRGARPASPRRRQSAVSDDRGSAASIQRSGGCGRGLASPNIPARVPKYPKYSRSKTKRVRTKSRTLKYMSRWRGEKGGARGSPARSRKGKDVRSLSPCATPRSPRVAPRLPRVAPPSPLLELEPSLLEFEPSPPDSGRFRSGGRMVRFCSWPWTQGYVKPVFVLGQFCFQTRLKRTHKFIHSWIGNRLHQSIRNRPGNGPIRWCQTRP